jgi:hypothetical protein
MATRWTLTIDCANPRRLAAFWAEALGYVEKPPPEGYASWDEWLASVGVPEVEWGDGAALTDPEGIGPGLSFLRVPESKIVKNRVHLDLQVGGGRGNPPEVRWPKVRAEVDRLTAAGATVITEYEQLGQPDHVLMTDPEGNEFCVL